MQDRLRPAAVAAAATANRSSGSGNNGGATTSTAGIVLPTLVLVQLVLPKPPQGRKDKGCNNSAPSLYLKLECTTRQHALAPIRHKEPPCVVWHLDCLALDLRQATQPGSQRLSVARLCTCQQQAPANVLDAASKNVVQVQLLGRACLAQKRQHSLMPATHGFRLQLVELLAKPPADAA